jgi:hypothetical protein
MRVLKNGVFRVANGWNAMWLERPMWSPVAAADDRAEVRERSWDCLNTFYTVPDLVGDVGDCFLFCWGGGVWSTTLICCGVDKCVCDAGYWPCWWKHRLYVLRVTQLGGKSTFHNSENCPVSNFVIRIEWEESREINMVKACSYEWFLFWCEKNDIDSYSIGRSVSVTLTKIIEIGDDMKINREIALDNMQQSVEFDCEYRRG